VILLEMCEVRYLGYAAIEALIFAGDDGVSELVQKSQMYPTQQN